MIEGTDFELIEPENENEYWACRILTGEFNETVIKFGAIALNEVEDQMSFNFYVLSSPDPNATIDNEDLQLTAHNILQRVIDIALEEGFAKITDKKTGENIEYRTDDTEESTY